MSRLITVGVFMLVIVAPVFAPFDPMLTNVDAVILPPNSTHLLGTDQLGRDVWSRLLYGGRTTLLSGFAALSIAALVGGSIGLVGGFFAGWLDEVLMIIINAWLAIPGLLLGLTVMTLLGQGILSTTVAVGIIQLAPFAQYTRTVAISIANSGYVTSGYAVGASKVHILWHYVLRGSIPALFSYSSVTFAYALLNIAAFGFLGLHTTPEWGVMLAEGREVLREAPWVSAVPAVAITLTVLAANAFADGFNPRR